MSHSLIINFITAFNILLLVFMVFITLKMNKETRRMKHFNDEIAAGTRMYTDLPRVTKALFDKEFRDYNKDKKEKE